MRGSGLALCASILAACSSQPTNVADGGTDASADVAVDVEASAPPAFPAFHSAFPQIINAGGPVVTSPRIVPVLFANDPLATQILDFLPKLTASTLWSGLAEYKVGAATVATAVNVNATAAASVKDADIQTWLLSQLDGTHAEWGPTDATTLANSVYVLFYPDTTTIDGAPSTPGTSCVDFGSYHANVAVPADGGASSHVVYVVMPRCAAAYTKSAAVQTELDELTFAATHELAEATTDPLTITAQAAYVAPDLDHLAWMVAVGGEIGDICATPAHAYADPDIGYVVQRIWSNKAIAAWKEPCLPVPSSEGPFFASVPVEADTVDLLLGSTHYAVKGTNVPLGQSKTVDIQLSSEADTGGPWTVEAFDVASLNSQPAALGLALDKSTGQNGDVLHLTITAKAKPTSLVATYILRSSLGTKKVRWIGTVGVN